MTVGIFEAKQKLSELVERAAVRIESARRTQLTVYDAANLQLAARRRLPLATLDDKLREAACRAGLMLT